jgi:hypothetical protein
MRVTDSRIDASLLLQLVLAPRGLERTTDSRRSAEDVAALTGQGAPTENTERL